MKCFKKNVKRIISVFIVLLIFLTSLVDVNARVVSINEFNDGFNNSPTIKELNNMSTSKIESKVNEVDKTIDVYAGTEKIYSFKYTDEYLEYSNRDVILTKENCSDDLSTLFMLSGILESMFKLSGHENITLSNDESMKSLTYEKDGIVLEGEHYNFEEESENGTLKYSGDFVRYFKISFDTEKIDAFATKYGVAISDDPNKEIINTITPTIKGSDVTETSITIYPNVSLDNLSSDTKINCHIYRSESIDGNYEKITNTPIDCVNSTGYTDSNLKSGTTYYYKTVIVGAEKYSDIISISTNGTINNVPENPKTGVSFPIVMLLLVFTCGIVLQVISKNKSPINQL